MNVICAGRNNREFLNRFEDWLYRKWDIIPDYDTCEEYLGRNFSFVIFENDNKNYMILFDADDGSGIASDNFKLKTDVFEQLKEEHNVEDYIVFKMQYSSKSPHNDYYPLKNKTYPLGYFPYFPDVIENFKHLNRYNFLTTPKDIDFLWMGTVNVEDKPPVWPANVDLKHWQLGQRIKGFNVLRDIAQRRTDLNVIFTDKRIPYTDYLKLLMRTKICIELPGVGNFTTRFFENLMMGKCIIGKELYLELPYTLKSHHHYIAVDSYDILETKMDILLRNDVLINDIERNVKKLQPSLTYKYAYDYILRILKEKKWRK